jgi:thiol:disulfide interchange protein DsbD
MELPVNKLLVAVLVVLAGTIGYRALHPSLAFAADGTDAAWDAAAREARESGKPTIVLFTADWCPACRALHAAFARPDVADELDHYYCFKMDLTRPTPQAQRHARQFGANYIPLMVRFDREGNETGRTNSMPVNQLVQWLKDGE